MKINEFIQNISGNKYNELLSTLYGENDKIISKQKERYINALKSFSSFFPNRDDVKMYSASGRTEIGGNHTDHQHGVVLAGAVNLDVIAVVSFHSDNIVRVKSEGYEPFETSLDNLSVNPDDSGTASRKLKNAGIIENAAEYDAFLMQHGYDRKLCTGTKTINSNDTWQQIAEKLISK